MTFVSTIRLSHNPGTTLKIILIWVAIIQVILTSKSCLDYHFQNFRMKIVKDDRVDYSLCKRDVTPLIQINLSLSVF